MSELTRSAVSYGPGLAAAPLVVHGPHRCPLFVARAAARARRGRPDRRPRARSRGNWWAGNGRHQPRFVPFADEGYAKAPQDPAAAARAASCGSTTTSDCTPALKPFGPGPWEDGQPVRRPGGSATPTPSRSPLRQPRRVVHGRAARRGREEGVGWLGRGPGTGARRPGWRRPFSVGEGNSGPRSRLRGRVRNCVSVRPAGGVPVGRRTTPRRPGRAVAARRAPRGRRTCWLFAPAGGAGRGGDGPTYSRTPGLALPGRPAVTRPRPWGGTCRW